MDTTIEAAKAFCHHGKSAFAFDPIVLKHMAEFSDAQNARLVSELETAKRALEAAEVKIKELNEIAMDLSAELGSP